MRQEVRDLFTESTFSDFLRIANKPVREFKNRHTGRFEREGRVFYIKMHEPCGWWPIAEDVLRLRKPRTGARPEWLTLQDLHAKGIAAPRPVAFGERGATLATQQSFVITEAIAPAVSLETIVKNPETWPLTPLFKRRLVRAVADIARNMHSSGINHRDFYLPHFLLDLSQGTSVLEQEKPKLHLIDLHRAQRRKRTPRRWLLKDLGGLLFSAMDVGLTSRDLALFIRRYSGGSLRGELQQNRWFWNDVFRCGEKLYRKIHGRPIPLQLPENRMQISTYRVRGAERDTGISGWPSVRSLLRKASCWIL